MLSEMKESLPRCVLKSMLFRYYEIIENTFLYDVARLLLPPTFRTSERDPTKCISPPES